jgi:hypothetical protein
MIIRLTNAATQWVRPGLQKTTQLARLRLLLALFLRCLRKPILLEGFQALKNLI